MEIAVGLDLRRENRELLRRLGIKPEDAPGPRAKHRRAACAIHDMKTRSTK